MNNKGKIVRWLIDNQEAALTIAAAAATPLLLDEEGGWIGESDFPSGADYIDHVIHFVD